MRSRTEKRIKKRVRGKDWVKHGEQKNTGKERIERKMEYSSDKEGDDSRGDKERESIPEKFMPVSYRNVKKE